MAKNKLTIPVKKGRDVSEINKALDILKTKWGFVPHYGGTTGYRDLGYYRNKYFKKSSKNGKLITVDTRGGKNVPVTDKYLKSLREEFKTDADSAKSLYSDRKTKLIFGSTTPGKDHKARKAAHALKIEQARTEDFVGKIQTKIADKLSRKTVEGIPISKIERDKRKANLQIAQREALSGTQSDRRQKQILTFKVKGGGIRRISPDNERYLEYLELHKKGTVLPALPETESGEASALADEEYGYTGKTKIFHNRASGKTNQPNVSSEETDKLNDTIVNEEKIEKKVNNIKRAQKAPADLQWIPEEALGGSAAKARAVIEKARAIERTYGFGNAGDERFKSNNEKLKQRLLNSPLDQLTFENM